MENNATKTVDDNANSNDGTERSHRSSTARSSYTESLAYDPLRLRQRTTIPKFCLLGLAPNSSIWDKILSYLSIWTGFVAVLVLCIVSVILIPSIIVTKLLGITNYFNIPDGDDGENVSKSGKGSITAIKTLSARSQMNLIMNGNGGPDYLAPIFMKNTSVFGAGIPGSQVVSQLMLLLFRWNFYVTGRIINDQLSEVIDTWWFPFKIGETALLQVRTCWLDDCVESFVRKHDDENTGKANINFVFLGAGYDSRCYRLNLVERGVHPYEVDAPGTQTEKLRVLKGSNISSSQTTYVSCDFESEDWLEKLRVNGFDSTLPTICVWEGVTMYLDRDIIQSTVAKIGSELTGPGSCIAFDYIDAKFALHPMMVKVTTKAGEPWKFGMESDEVQDMSKFISRCKKKIDDDRNNSENGDLKVLDHLRHEELIKRYLPTHYDGRPIGFLGDFGGLLLIGIG